MQAVTKKEATSKKRMIALVQLQIFTSLVNAVKDRDMAVLNVPNTFIQMVVVDKQRQVIIQIRGVLVDMLVSIAPNVYKEYVTVDKKEINNS